VRTVPTVGVIGSDPLEDVASGIETGRIGHRDLDKVTPDADPEGGLGADGDGVAVVDHDGVIRPVRRSFADCARRKGSRLDSYL
jgi:hypothetical protein